MSPPQQPAAGPSTTGPSATGPSTTGPIRTADRTVRDAYERVPYPSGAQHPTHPDNLAVLARLGGLDPAPVERCRVLEIGCADGGNLIAMAAGLPEARFVGIDLSPGQIEAGRREAAALGLDNLRLEAMSLLDLGERLGRFDYIVAHGVFSWVPEDVQEELLAICRRCLEPHGVAYVSYNVYPGWHLRGVVRDLLRFHTRGEADPHRRIALGRELIELLAEAAAGRDDAQAVFLRATRDHLEEYRERPSYLIHEYLEETNAPLYFHRFAERAAGHGLRYLCEAGRDPLETGALPPRVIEAIGRFAGDPVARGQYLDFFGNRGFRRSLLVHREARPADGAAPGAETRRLAGLTVASPVRPREPAADPAAPGAVSFVGRSGGGFSTAHPVVKTALIALAGRWPAGIAYEELAARIAQRVAGDAAGVLADFLPDAFRSGVVELSTLGSPCVARAGERPRASALARRQAARGELVTDLRHRVTRIDDALALRLLSLLDGTRDRSGLVGLLEAEAAAGRLEIGVGEGPPAGPGERRRLLAAVVDAHLDRLAEHALLIA